MFMLVQGMIPQVDTLYKNGTPADIALVGISHLPMTGRMQLRVNLKGRVLL